MRNRYMSDYNQKNMCLSRRPSPQRHYYSVLMKLQPISIIIFLVYFAIHKLLKKDIMYIPLNMLVEI